MKRFAVAATCALTAVAAPVAMARTNSAAPSEAKAAPSRFIAHPARTSSSRSVGRRHSGGNEHKGAPTKTPAPPTTTTTTPTTPRTTPTTTTTPTTPRTTPTTTTTAPPSTTPPPTTTTTTPPPTPSAVEPVGVPGSWNLAFDDEFNGTSLDTSKWTTLNGWSMNNVTTETSNVTEGGGVVTLTLSSSSEGAEIDSSPADGAGRNGFLLPVGDFAEARIDFPGSGSTIYNWPAWWTSGPDWPAAGENDIAEGLGTLTTNYHSPGGAYNQGTIPGTWSNGFHTYGLYRGAGFCNVYYDGVLVKTYTTNDNGNPQALLINVGQAGNAVTGTASQVKVDYVRAWSPS